MKILWGAAGEVSVIASGPGHRVAGEPQSRRHRRLGWGAWWSVWALSTHSFSRKSGAWRFPCRPVCNGEVCEHASVEAIWGDVWETCLILLGHKSPSLLESLPALCAPPRSLQCRRSRGLSAGLPLPQSGHPWRHRMVRSGCDGGTLVVSPQGAHSLVEVMGSQTKHRHCRAACVVEGGARRRGVGASSARGEAFEQQGLFRLTWGLKWPY